MKLPAFVTDVTADPRQRGVLVAGTVALFAVGLVPRVLSPGLPTLQTALRSEPALQSLFLLLVFIGTVAIIAGGLASDLIRRRSLFVAALATMLGASVAAIFLGRGDLFYLASFVVVLAQGVVLAYGIGSVAIAYEGVPRATALGFVYAAYGAGSAISPALLTLFPQVTASAGSGTPASYTYITWPAFGLTAIASGVALWAAYRWMPAIPGQPPASRWVVVELGLWSIAILALVSGVLGLVAPGGWSVPLALILGGTLAIVLLGSRIRDTVKRAGQLALDQRGLGAALAVGITVGFAQTIPLMLLPVVFQYALGYGAILAMVAIAPFAISLLLAGPVAGVLMQRFGPREIMSGGTLALGLANLLLALSLVYVAGQIRAIFEADPTATGRYPSALDYLLFILPLVAVGAGFVLSTTVRTAIVFASTPRGLPGSAAAVNEASVSLGSRIGIVSATTALTLVAMASARAMLTGLPEDRRQALLDEFSAALTSVGTPRLQSTIGASLEDASPAKLAAYAAAYLDGVTAALVIGGAVGIVGAVVAWFLTGHRDPLRTVFDLAEERQDGDAGSVSGDLRTRDVSRAGS